MWTTRRAMGLAVAVLVGLGTTSLLLPGPARAVTLLSEDFESGALGPSWNATDNNPASGLDYWGVTSFRSNAGTYSGWAAFVGTQASGGQPNTAVNRYDNDMEADLSYAVPPGYFSLSVSLYYWAKGEGGGGDLFQVWYDDNAVLTMLFENRGAATWEFTSMVVPDTADRLIFRWRSDAANNNFEGAYLDDIVLTAAFGGPDLNAPWSTLLALPALTNLTTYPIGFTAADGANETGVAYVELWSRQGAVGPFSLYTTIVNPLGRWPFGPIPFDSAAALGDGYYEFYSVAVDNATNAEAPPVAPDASMTIDPTPPSLVLLAPAPGSWSATDNVTVAWNGSDALSGLDRYDTSLDAGPFASVGNATNQSFPGLTEGLHIVDIVAYDLAGNPSLQNASFGVDLTDPAVAVSAPAPGTWFATDNVTVVWNGSDAPSGLDRYETSLDAGAFVANGLLNFTFFPGLTEGAHTVDVVAYDLAGRMATASVNFSVDLSGPAVAVTSPAPGSWSATDNVTVAWTGSDALSGLDRYETSLDAGPFASVGNATNQSFPGLTEGGHTVTVRAFDALGNAATDSVGFSIDLSDPTVAITSPAPGAWVGASAVTVSWSGSDLFSGVAQYEARVDGSAFASNGLLTSRLFPGLTAGWHTVDVQAYDALGHVAAASVTFGVDVDLPGVMVTSPATGSWFAAGTVQVTWTGSDAPSGLDRYETRVDGGAFVPNGLLTSMNLTGLSEGAHTVDVMVFDAAGNSALATVGFDVDLTAPTLAVTAPVPGAWSAASSVTVAWSASDSSSGLDRFEARLDGAAFASNGLGTSLVYSGLAEGTHTVDVRAYDLVGNLATSSVTFSVDLTAPTVAVSGPAAGSWFGGSPVAVSWTGTDPLSGLDRYETRLDAGAYSGNGLTATRTFSALAEGAHTVVVRAVDRAGNAATASVAFSVDLTAPTVAVTSPTGSAWLALDSILASWSGSDAGSGPARFESRLDGAAFVSRGLASNQTLASLTEGAHTFEVRVYDRVGLFATASAAFSVDLTPPSLTVTSPAAGSWLGATDTTVTWSSADALSGIARYETRLDSGTFASNGLAVDEAFSALADGPHTVDVRAYDQAGNRGDASVAFGIDTAAPTLALGTPAPGTVITAGSVIVTWSGQDATSGIDHYEVRIDGGAVVVTDDLSQTFSGLGDGSHTVEIRALDASGNAQEATLTFRVNTNVLTWDGPFGPWVLLSLILFPLLLLLLLFLLVRRRRRDDEKKAPGESPPPGPEANAPTPAEGEAEFPPPPLDADAPDAAGTSDAPFESPPSSPYEGETPGASDAGPAPDMGTAGGVQAGLGVVPLPVEAPPAPMVEKTSKGDSRCAACQGRIREGFPLLRCPSCPAVYHVSCGARASVCTTCGLLIAAPA